MWIFLLPTKSDVIAAITSFLLMVKNVYTFSVKFLRTDNGCEFFNFSMETIATTLRDYPPEFLCVHSSAEWSS